MTLIDNLTAINNCKNAIKTALENKGVVMTDVKFEDYAGKIDALQFESGDTPSTPTPSADYIYCNGYAEGGKTNEITNLIPYEIELNDEGKFEIELMCPAELWGFINDMGENVYCDILFTVDVPTSYSIDKFEFYNPIGSGSYVERTLKANPRYLDDSGNPIKVVRNGVEYYSYVRQTSDGIDYYSSDVQTAPLKYRITIMQK
jgi:hypothetical protein